MALIQSVSGTPYPQFVGQPDLCSVKFLRHHLLSQCGTLWAAPRGSFIISGRGADFTASARNCAWKEAQRSAQLVMHACASRSSSQTDFEIIRRRRRIGSDLWFARGRGGGPGTHRAIGSGGRTTPIIARALGLDGASGSAGRPSSSSTARAGPRQERCTLQGCPGTGEGARVIASESRPLNWQECTRDMDQQL